MNFKKNYKKGNKFLFSKRQKVFLGNKFPFLRINFIFNKIILLKIKIKKIKVLKFFFHHLQFKKNVKKEKNFLFKRVKKFFRK